MYYVDSESDVVLDQVVDADKFTERPLIRTQSLTTGPLHLGAEFAWRVQSISDDGPGPWTEPYSFRVRPPSSSQLFQNYPNPFSRITTIEFDQPYSSQVRLVVFDLAGREVSTVLDQTVPAGRHAVTWNAHHVPPGVYLYRLETWDFVDMKGTVVIR